MTYRTVQIVYCDGLRSIAKRVAGSWFCLRCKRRVPMVDPLD